MYEAYASPADGLGGMLGLSPNGLDALAAIDLDGAVRRVAEPVSAMVVQSWTGKQLAKFDERQADHARDLAGLRPPSRIG